MAQFTRGRGTALWVAVLLALAVNAVVTFINVQELIKNEQAVEHSRELMFQIERLISSVKDAETGQRGYLITFDESYLEPYERSLTDIASCVDALRAITVNRPYQRESLDQATALIDQQLFVLEVILLARTEADRDVARFLVSTGENKRIMDELRLVTDEMHERERERLKESKEKSQAKHSATILTTIVGGGLTLGITGLALFVARAELSRRRQAELELRAQGLELRSTAEQLTAAHQRSQENLTLLEAFLNNSPVGFAFLDRESRLVRLNEPFAEVAKTDSRHDIGLPLTDLSAPFGPAIAPDLKKVLSEREPIVDRLLLESPSDLEHPRTWQATLFPILANDDNLLGVGLMVRDITLQLRHDRVLRESQARFRNLAESMPQFVWVTRADGYVEYFNERWFEYNGLTRDETLGYKWLDLIHPDDRERTRQRWQESLGAGTVYEIEYRIRGKDGQHRWFLGRGLPQRDEADRVVNWFGTCTDIDERKRQAEYLEAQVQLRVRELSTLNQSLQTEIEHRMTAEAKERAAGEELRRSNRELEQFAYVASHDLQEPLRKIQAFGDRLVGKHRSSLPDEAREYLDRMTTSATRMRRLIDDLLAFSRVSTQGYKFSRVELTSVAEAAAADLEETLRQANGRLEIEKLPVVNGDPTLLQQVFANLFGNAMKFRRPDVAPVARVTSAISEERLDPNGPVRHVHKIEVVDNGIGFDPSYGDRIFQLFQRLHGRQEFEGTGIGLAICRKVVERHGGRIFAASAEGEGSRFTILFPVDPRLNRSS